MIASPPSALGRPRRVRRPSEGRDRGGRSNGPRTALARRAVPAPVPVPVAPPAPATEPARIPVTNRSARHAEPERQTGSEAEPSPLARARMTLMFHNISYANSGYHKSEGPSQAGRGTKSGILRNIWATVPAAGAGFCHRPRTGPPRSVRLPTALTPDRSGFRAAPRPRTGQRDGPGDHPGRAVRAPSPRHDCPPHRRGRPRCHAVPCRRRDRPRCAGPSSPMPAPVFAPPGDGQLRRAERRG